MGAGEDGHVGEYLQRDAKSHKVYAPALTPVTKNSTKDTLDSAFERGLLSHAPFLHCPSCLP